MGLIDKLKDARLGFAMHEIMDGTHRFEHGCGPTGRLPMEFRVNWGAKRLGPFLDPFGEEFLRSDLDGTVTVGGLCTRAPCTGTLALKYFSENSITYTFDFEAGGEAYTYVGNKVNIWPWNLPVSHTTCFGTIKESNSGKLISTSALFFRLWRSPSFVTSFRLV